MLPQPYFVSIYPFLNKHQLETKIMTRFLLPWFIVQFFTWLALFAMWIYTTPFVIKYIYPSGAEDIASSAAIKWVGICFALYSLLAALLAFTLPKIVARFSIAKVHSTALLFGSLGLLVIYFVKSPYTLLLGFAFIGIAWSSISNLPYVAVSNRAPENKMSFYMGVFNFSIVIPQITAAFLLSWLSATFFNGETKYIMLTGSGCMLVASTVCWFWVKGETQTDFDHNAEGEN